MMGEPTPWNFVCSKYTEEVGSVEAWDSHCHTSLEKQFRVLPKLRISVALSLLLTYAIMAWC
jgi:hypothetical protein